MLDIDFVRRQFPALETPWALFDNAGGTVLPQHVITRATDYMRRYQIQLGASYPLSVEAGEHVLAGRRAMAQMVHAELEEVVIGHSTSLNLRLLAAALRPLWQAGDEVVVTNLDHEANIAPWRDLEASGIVVREWALRPETASLELEDLELLLNERTRLVCFTHCSNVVGAVHDVAAFVRRIHQAGALVCVDGVGFAPHRRLDVKALDVDFYSLSLYKACGPHVALLYCRRELLQKAYRQNHSFLGDKLPDKMQPGNVNFELTVSLLGIFDYFDALEAHHFDAPSADRGACLERIFSLVAAYEEQLARPLIEYLRQQPKVRLFGPGPSSSVPRLPILTFAVQGKSAPEVVAHLETLQVAARHGDFYAPRAIEALGLKSVGGVVRVSMAHYNHPSEVARVIRGLETLG